MLTFFFFFALKSVNSKEILHHFPYYYSHLEAVFLYWIKSITINYEILLRSVHEHVQKEKGKTIFFFFTLRVCLDFLVVDVLCRLNQFLNEV